MPASIELSIKLVVCLFLVQHAHIENVKTVANLTNNKDVFIVLATFRITTLPPSPGHASMSLTVAPVANVLGLRVAGTAWAVSLWRRLP